MIEVVDTGNISTAAQNLFISQPSLSKALQELEEEIGFKLFLRTNKGVVLSTNGSEFLSYARQVVEQMSLLEQRFVNAKPMRQNFSISTHHYAFVVEAFVSFVQKYALDEYEFHLQDTKTYDILENVRLLRSEIGVIYLNNFNQKVMKSILKNYDLQFTALFEAEPHVFISSNHPLAKKACIALSDLEPYPCLRFEQGEQNSFYFSEEILSILMHEKSIYVSDRATIFNLMIGLKGYTISTGVINANLNGNGIIAIPLNVDDRITVGWIASKKVKLSPLANRFIKELEETVKNKRTP